MQKTNQFLLEIKDAELLEVLFDGTVQWGNPLTDHTKLVALFAAGGNEQESDILTITFFDKRADIVAGFPDGARLNINAKVQTRFIAPKNGGDEFPATEVLGYFVEEYKPETPRQNQRSGGSARSGANPTRRAPQHADSGANDSSANTRQTGRNTTRRTR